jgi:hypothetical protein
MLMIIFGAGATYDSAPWYPPRIASSADTVRPPLAQELFGIRFAGHMKTYPLCQALIPHLQEGKKAVEESLEEFLEESSSYPVRHRQLAAIRFYLREMIYRCETEWSYAHSGVTNYKTLLDRVEQFRTKDVTPDDFETIGGYRRVCIVSFNWDTMLEDAMTSVRILDEHDARQIRFNTINSYIADDSYKVLKIHGSVNWVRKVSQPGVHPNDLLDETTLIERAGELDYGAYVVQASFKDRSDGPRFPAIAIPVQRKQVFECPSDHVEVLRKLIPETNKLLIVGWRGAERHFVDLLRTLPKHVQGLIVSGNEKEAQTVAHHLRRLPVKWTPTPIGFSELVVSDTLTGFLRR